MNQNPMWLMSQLNNFRQTIQGDPKDQVMKMVNSGQVSQAQLNQAQQMATQLERILQGK